jgi:two-component system response regulator WspF
MKEAPCAILIVTATVEGNAAKVFQAMGYGALDAVKTPVLGLGNQTAGGQELLDKITIIKRLLCPPGNVDEEVAAPPGADVSLPNLVAIGASTGGPKALADILSHLPATIDAAFVIVQHVNPEFVRDLSEWLGGQTPLPVRLAQKGDSLEQGKVFLAASDNHLRLTPHHTLTYTVEPRDCFYRPSVDVFFESAKTCWPRKAIAVLLTGMGRDGAAGLLELRRAGWHTIAQDEKSSVIYGMPKAAAALDAAVEILPLDEIAARLVDRVGRIARPGG